MILYFPRFSLGNFLSFHKHFLSNIVLSLLGVCLSPQNSRLLYTIIKYHLLSLQLSYPHKSIVAKHLNTTKKLQRTTSQIFNLNKVLQALEISSSFPSPCAPSTKSENWVHKKDELTAQQGKLLCRTLSYRKLL